MRYNVLVWCKIYPCVEIFKGVWLVMVLMVHGLERLKGLLTLPHMRFIPMTYTSTLNLFTYPLAKMVLLCSAKYHVCWKQVKKEWRQVNKILGLQIGNSLSVSSNICCIYLEQLLRKYLNWHFRIFGSNGACTPLKCTRNSRNSEWFTITTSCLQDFKCEQAVSFHWHSEHVSYFCQDFILRHVRCKTYLSNKPCFG